jgi:hypothetical protein
MSPDVLNIMMFQEDEIKIVLSTYILIKENKFKHL